ncbi:MAG TPA: methyltransferase domain-containing protein [Xanthobacteraceae bacterium]|jgi:predicted methyltransferase|nr:methyltransferase domain-containing protein [Xanthobacteraceae bacterium]
MNGKDARIKLAAAMLGIAVSFASFATGAQAQAAPDYAALLAAPDRSENDRQADKRRDPLPFLQFAAPMPGMKVLDMGAGGGYSTELMARTVAPNGTVYGQNPADASDKIKDAFQARLATPGMKNAQADARPFDDPAPPGTNDLDMITFLFFYHDTTYMNVDRAAMNKAMFAALKPGGYLVIADHAALPGQGTTVGKTLHRIEENTERQEIEAAGFKFVGEGNFWRNDADTHDYPSYKKDVPIDNFVLKFQKPM